MANIDPIIGVHSPLEANLVEQLGANTIWISGYCISASCFAMPDLDLSSPDDKLRIIARIINTSSLRVIVDLDSGMDNPVDFAAYLTNLNALGPTAVCIEDEQIPKTSALYASKKPLISPAAFNDRLAFVRQHVDCQVIARTNAIVRGYTPNSVKTRIECVLAQDSAEAIALHGSDVGIIESTLNAFPHTDFYFITSLLPERDFEHIAGLRFKGLIFAHDLLFSAILNNTEISRKIIQQLKPSAHRHEASRLIQILVNHECHETNIKEEMQAYYCVFHTIPAPDSTGSRHPIPRDSGT